MEKVFKMKITKTKLKQIIKEETSKVLHEASPADVEAVIDRFSSPEAKEQWNMARNDFQWMARGEHIPGVSDEYYKGWEPKDFQAVINAVEGR